MQKQTALRPVASGECTSSLHVTPLGTLEAWWTPRGLRHIGWNPAAAGDRSRLPSPVEAFLTEGRSLDGALTAYFEGGFSALDGVRIDCDGWSPFFAAVYRVCRSIPAGQTLAYGELAAAVGSPRAARAVGQAMASNRVPLVIPCHRVVAATGRLHGYSGPGGCDTKQWLLRHERGVPLPPFGGRAVYS